MEKKAQLDTMVAVEKLDIQVNKDYKEFEERLVILVLKVIQE